MDPTMAARADGGACVSAIGAPGIDVSVVRRGWRERVSFSLDASRPSRHRGVRTRSPSRPLRPKFQAAEPTGIRGLFLLSTQPTST